MQLIILVHIVGRCEDRIFDERDVSFNLGEGANVNVLESIEKALEKFKKGETSKLIIAPKHGFDQEGSNQFGVPPNATLEYIVTLKTFEKVLSFNTIFMYTYQQSEEFTILFQARDSWALDSEEKVEEGKRFKEKGTTYFKAGKINLAIKMYKKGIGYLDFEKGN